MIADACCCDAGGVHEGHDSPSVSAPFVAESTTAAWHILPASRQTPSADQELAKAF